MALWTMEALGFVAAILFLLYYYLTSTFDFWRKRGVQGPKPIPFFGNFLDVFLARDSVSDCFTNAYSNYKDEPLVGLFGGSTPLLVVKDPDLIKDVLIKDFPCFAERTLSAVEEDSPKNDRMKLQGFSVTGADGIFVPCTIKTGESPN